MGSEGSQKHMVVTQVSVGGFDNYVTAKMLCDYLEANIGAVWRCRLKTSSTPPNSYPNFVINPTNVLGTNDYKKVEPHAFVHFAMPDSSMLALDYAGRGELIFEEKPLKVSLGPETPYHMNQRRRTTIPFKISDVRVEIGILVSPDEFFVGWRAMQAVIRCNFKIEFLVRDIDEIKQDADMSSLIVLLQLASSPLIYYRTADDDIEESVPFDLLDDDDPWIRTTDFTPSGAIGRCNTYRISIRPRNGPNLEKAMDYLKEQRVQVSNYCPTQQLRIRDEPDFGIPMSDPFFCIPYKTDVSFKILFLVNAVMHKGIINQHQLSDSFFHLLRSQRDDVNVAALKHIYSHNCPLNDACRRLELVQEWLLKNPKLLERPRELNNVVKVRRLVITPTKAYCLPPEAELSNRVLRNYREVADRFLRVTFMDEGMQTLNKNAIDYYPAPILRDITSNFNSQKTKCSKE
ncbi:unnamed protein product [Ilex paraguariensis]|uniref:RNA-dependent RNA polymerase n=1 Tax=Ilex paraguariensis TaxID=185542 RepID=A0ABC8QP82_9AQUA